MVDADARLKAILDAAIPFALPLRRTFRGLQVREGVLIRGPRGWGEFAPFDDYPPAAAARWLDSALEAAYSEWPTAQRDAVEVNAIIPAVDSDDAAGLTREAVLDHGCRTIKVKVGSTDPGADEARVASVRDVLDTVLGRGRGSIRIDANGSWDVATAVDALRRLSAYGLEYVEQPCRTSAELRELRRSTDVPIAADEVIRTADDPGAVRVAGLADIAIVKPATLGGVAATLRIVERLGVPVVVSGSLDSSVGLDVALAAAAALDELPFACGLGTGALLAADVIDTPRVPEAGALTVQRTAPDLSALLAARDRLSEERASWWRTRLAEAWAAGAADRGGQMMAATDVKG
jgi:o-succinylbenzoate synthase